jgi:uncharacterized protein (TIGR02285 family)
MKSVFFFITIFLSLAPQDSRCESIQLLYPNRPPFHYTLDGKAVGSLVELTERIFIDAGLEFTFKEMPSMRILAELKRRESGYCSFGWFKNAEREAFATFTLPIIQYTPLVALVLKKNAQLFANRNSLKEIASEKGLTVGLIQGWSYGDYVDNIMTTEHVQIMGIPERRNQPLMLVNERFTYTLVREAELDEIINLSGKPQQDFLVIPLSDLQDRSERYILCGKGVPEDVIAKLNTSIEKICGVLK